MDVIDIDKLRQKHEQVRDDRLNSKLAKFLKDKKVILVGPDTTMIGSKMGQMIEEYDVIVRINTALNFVPYKKEWVEDIGARTDIFYLCPSSMKWFSEQDKKDAYDKLIQSSARFICYQNGHNKAKYISGDYVYPEVKETIKNWLISPSKPSKVKTQLSSSHQSCQVLCDLLTQLSGHRVLTRTGLLAIWDLLNHGARQVRVVGMSFYHGGGHMFRKIEGEELDPLKDHLAHKSYHDSYAELALFKQFIEFFGSKLIIDDGLQTIIEKTKPNSTK